MNKREVYAIFIFSILVMFVLSSPVLSANIFSDIWNKITGYATTGNTSLNITINSPPTIPTVYINTSYDPVIGSVKAITFNFTATDFFEEKQTSSMSQAEPQSEFNNLLLKAYYDAD